MSIEILKAVAGLWPIALLAFLTLCVLVFKGQLRTFLNEHLHFSFKKGDTEISWNKREKAPEPTAEGTGEQPGPEKAGMGESDKNPEEASPNGLVDRYDKALSENNRAELESSFEDIQRAAQDPGARIYNEARHYYHLYGRVGDESALRKLQTLAKREEADAPTKHWLALAYVKAGDHARAAETFEESAKSCDVEEERARSIARAADSLYESGKREEAFARIMLELGKAGSKEVESHLYEGLATLYEKAREPELRALAIEKALEGRPNNPSLRFQAALGYDHESFTRLALMHYRKQLDFHPDDVASLNNIGIEYDRLKMPMRSVRNFKKSAEHNETLAMANLAYQFLSAGFASEATQILDRARTMADVHSLVGSAIAYMAQMEEAEKEVEEKCIEAAHDQQRFLAAFGEAFFVTQSKKQPAANFAGRWKLPDGVEIDVTQVDGTIQSTWEVGTTKLSLTGIVRNRGFKGVIGETPQYTFTASKSRLFGYMADNSDEFQVLRSGNADDNHAIVVYKKVAAAEALASLGEEPVAAAS